MQLNRKIWGSCKETQLWLTNCVPVEMNQGWELRKLKYFWLNYLKRSTTGLRFMSLHLLPGAESQSPWLYVFICSFVYFLSYNLNNAKGGFVRSGGSSVGGGVGLLAVKWLLHTQPLLAPDCSSAAGPPGGGTASASRGRLCTCSERTSQCAGRSFLI